MLLMKSAIIIEKYVNENFYDDTILFHSYSGISIMRDIDEYADTYDEAYELIVDSYETITRLYG